MANSLRRPISMLLILLLIIGLFTAFPAASAGAVANTSGAWIFAANDGRTYDLDGKWVRFGDEEFQLSGTGEFSLTARTTYIYQLKYGTTHIADSRSTQAGAIHIGDTFYVTGQGTEDHPYIFTPNVIFYDNTVTTFGKGATVSMGYENLDATASGNNGVAVPGDGFRSVSRMQVGASNYVRFLQHDELDYQPNQVSTVLGYIGVKDGEYGTYNGSGSFTNATNHFSFDSGNETLYYLGRDDYGENGLYQFSETVDKRTNFSGTNQVICTVTWENQDGTKLRTMTYNLGETADDGGLTPTKAEDAAYTYSFTGFEPAYEPLTDDMTYVAAYEATPKGPMTYSVDAWIFSTNDGKVYDTVDDLEHKCYSYNNILGTFPAGGGSFSVVNDQLLLCDLVVADIDTSKSYKEFANTVYVTGSGEQNDPFIFHPNYIYGDTTKTNVKDGPAIAVDSSHSASGDKGVANPGDGFKAMSRIRVGTSMVQFLQQYGYFTATRSLLGVGETTYGYRYSKTKALPFNFVSSDDTLYYFEQNKDSGIYQFSETSPPLKRSFSPSDSTIHTVTWKNYDGTVLGAESYYVNDMPSYKGGTPVKPYSDGKVYPFTGWTPQISLVTGDVDYTAAFGEESIFNKHSLTLDGIIGVNFYVLMPAGYNADNTTMDFSWGNKYISTNTYSESESYTKNGVEGKTVENSNLIKFTVPVAAKELNDEITAVLKDSSGNTIATDTYKGTDYAYEVLASDKDTYDKDAELKTLVKNMLIYSAKAQVNFEYNEENLATYRFADLDISTDLSTVDTSKLSGNTISSLPEGVSYYGSSMNLGSETSYMIVFRNDNKLDLTLSAAYKDTDTALETSVKNSGIATGLSVLNLPAARVLDDVAITIKNGSEEYEATVNTGTYFKTVLNGSYAQGLKDVLTALYHYNSAAKEYFD